MRKLFLMMAVIAIGSLAACSDDNSEPIQIAAKRTVLIYVAGNNNLSSTAHINLQDIVQGAAKANVTNDNLIVYFSVAGQNPKLYRISTEGKELVKTYPEQNAATQQILGEVITEVKTLYPAPEYGLILWSHGTSWLPKGTFDSRSRAVGYNTQLLTKTFGQEADQEIELRELAAAIPDRAFDFIAFDACFMGAAEVAFELRNKCKYMIASAAEILAAGFPYSQIIEPLFAPVADLKQVARLVAESYLKQVGERQTITIAVTDMSQMQPLASIMRSIVDGKTDAIADMNVSGVQYFDRRRNHFAYDLLQFAETIEPNQARIDQLNTALKRCVIYSAHSQYLFSEIKVDRHCGLSIFIPRRSESTKIIDAYQSTQWYRQIYQ